MKQKPIMTRPWPEITIGLMALMLGYLIGIAVTDVPTASMTVDLKGPTKVRQVVLRTESGHWTTILMTKDGFEFGTHPRLNRGTGQVFPMRWWGLNEEGFEEKE